jgi:hypothetical protein
MQIWLVLPVAAAEHLGGEVFVTTTNDDVPASSDSATSAVLLK